MLMKTAKGWVEASGQNVDEQRVRVIRRNIFDSLVTVPHEDFDKLFENVEEDRSAGKLKCLKWVNGKNLLEDFQIYCV